jgi:Holliday junction DNA helicase RuvA
MITKMTGVLTRVFDDEVRLEVGPFEYQLLVPEAVRRVIQLRTGTEMTFHVTEYLEGNSGGNRFVPRRIGFLTEAEVDFFDLFCTVEKIGAKKALKAMARPVKEIADAIARQDARWLSTLPGIGATTAEQIVTTLKRKVAKFAMMAGTAEPPPDAVVQKASGRRKPAVGAEQGADAPRSPEATVVDGRVIDDVYQALMGLGHTPVEARTRVDDLIGSGKPFRTVSDALTIIYGSGRG